MLAAISRRVLREGLANVKPIRGDESDPRLPRGKLDAILSVNTYNEIGDKITMLRNLGAALKPQGRFGIVDFKLEGGGPGPPIDERVDPKIVIRDAAAAGLQLASQEMFLPYQYVLVFSKAPASASKPTAESHSKKRP
jgi:SAM-dependent methyltransferase